MVQTEIVESSFVKNENNMEIRTMDECLAVYKTQVKLFTYYLEKKIYYTLNFNYFKLETKIKH